MNFLFTEKSQYFAEQTMMLHWVMLMLYHSICLLARQFFKTTGQNVSFFKHQFSKINKAFNKIMQKQKNWNNILMNNKAKFCIRLLHILPHGCPIIFIDLLYHHEKRLTHKRHISSNIAFTLQNALPSPFNDPTTMVSN